MPKRCARCGSISRVRELTPPGEWVSHLRAERDLAPTVGTVTMPLCPECYRDADRLLDGDDDGARDDFLDEVDLDALIDEGV